MRTIALKQVADVAAAVSIPIVGMGGVESGAHARDLLAAGARVVAVGTASFRDPLAAERIRAELVERRRASVESRRQRRPAPEFAIRRSPHRACTRPRPEVQLNSHENPSSGLAWPVGVYMIAAS